jgi:spore maturation protein CgeB
MRVVLFCHSLLSDWNHGNAHFLRGVVRELQGRGHAVDVYEPRGGWSRSNLVADHGPEAVEAIGAAFPDLRATEYDADRLDLDRMLDGADVVLVHEWTEPALVARLNRRRAAGGRFRLLFHDTHHRAATEPAAMAAYDLDAFDGVLAFGAVLRDIYRRRGWARRAWVWHEAADTSVFHPLPGRPREGDLVWVGNWGDDERTAELETFLLGPVRSLGLSARAHGVRFPPDGRQAFAAAGVACAGWLPNHRVPDTFARFGATVHVPRRPYAAALPGIPTIRVFEALACGIPLVSAPWDDAEGLFRPGEDYLVARDGAGMARHLRAVLSDPDLAAALRTNGLAAIRDRHTCRHRVDQLLALCAGLGAAETDPTPAPAALQGGT